MKREEVKLELIEEAEMLDGLLVLTSGNLGAAHALLEKTIKETVKAIKATLQQVPTPLLDSTIKETARQDTINKCETYPASSHALCYFPC